MHEILISGAKGMFGQDAVKIFSDKGYKVIPVDFEDFDITNKTSVANYFKNLKCDLIIHAAAYTNVDLAESEKEKAFMVNATGTENLAEISAVKNIPIVYISTDYVFNGQKKTPYLPDDAVNPINIYGESKLAGEIAVKKLNKKHYITRTSWLYGRNGKNFIETMINLSKTQPEIKVVDDQTGCPTWTYDLAEGILSIIENKKPYGTYHICGSGFTSWYGLAKKVFEIKGINTTLVPVKTEAFPRPAKRPQNSIMENNGICRHWEESLRLYLNI